MRRRVRRGRRWAWIRARPARTTVTVQPGVAVADTVTVAAGGSVYVELVPPVDGAGQVTVSGQLVVEASATGGSPVAATVIPMLTYPDPCGDPVTSAVTAEWSETVAIDSGCQLATVVFTNTAGEGAAVEVSWTAVLVEDSAEPNFGFETGSLAPWTVVDSGDGTPGVDPLVEVITPGFNGTDHAARVTTTPQPVDGLEQTLTAQIADCGVSVSALGNAGTTATLRSR